MKTADIKDNKTIDVDKVIKKTVDAINKRNNGGKKTNIKRTAKLYREAQQEQTGVWESSYKAQLKNVIRDIKRKQYELKKLENRLDDLLSKTPEDYVFGEPKPGQVINSSDLAANNTIRMNGEFYV